MSFFKKIFNPIFFLLFILSIFLIEGEYKFYLFTFWSIFLLFFSFAFIKDLKISKCAVLALILSVLFIINTIFAKQIPLSLEKLMFYMVSLGIFIFFRSFQLSEFKLKNFFYYLSILTLITNFLVFIFMFYQEPQSLFPGMNLLVRSYGHNHYAAFLLLVIPIFWWKLLLEQKNNDTPKNIFFYIVLLFSSYLIILLSLARLALIISLLQLFAIVFTNRKLFSMIKSHHVLKMIIKIFTFAFLSIALIFLFLSIPFNQKGESICPLIFNKKELCKPINENDRFLYWQKALFIFKENPYFGVGLKNFNFSIRNFTKETTTITSYAHNIFLHNLAEGGVFLGVFFIFFIIYLFYQSFLIIKQNANYLQRFLLIAAMSSLLNAMFDFDWNFFIIFTLSLIYLAIILQSKKSVNKTIINKKTIIFYFLFILLINLFFSFSDVAIRILNKENKHNLIVKYFPYMNTQIRNLWIMDKFKEENFTTLYFLYKKDPDFLYKFSTLKNLDKNKKVDLQIELATIDPLMFLKNISFTNLDSKVGIKLAREFMSVSEKRDYLNNLNNIDYWDQRNMAVKFVDFADQAYLANDLSTSVYFYKNAIFLNKYILNDKRAIFLKDDDFARASIFLSEFKNFNPKDMHQYWYPYVDFYEKTLFYLFQKNQIEEFVLLTEAILKQNYELSWPFLKSIFSQIKSIEEKKRILLIYDYFPNMSTWYGFLSEIQRFRTELSNLN